MGQTLENGVYLPSEGERNCYAGLKTNWEILDQKVADVTALQQAVAGALHRQIVASLPTTDIDPNTIYMVLSGTSATENVYNEFMYVNNAWELIGTSATDLTNYYTKAEVDGKLLLKANASDLTSHTGDTTIHVTASDKAKWTNSAKAVVFRYSSTVLVASSTNSNTLLDNTDNLKVGDKVIDSSGVLFSITAIDTQNSTFTIGTALIDLANDSDVVHKSGDETVAGIKNFTDDTYIKSLNFTNETVTYTDQTASKVARINLRITASGDKSLYPHENNQYALGLTSRKWSEVHGVTYYYGSSDTEFSDKFVTTDTAQNVTANKNFKGLITTLPDSPLWTLNTNTTADITSLASTCIHVESRAAGSLLDLSGGAWYIAQIGTGCFFFRQNTGTDIRYKHFPTNVVSKICVMSNDNKFISNLVPDTTNAYDLGNSSFKWKSFNGLNPSSLGMPDLSNGIDISSYITQGTGHNEYTPPANGYVSIILKSTSATAIFLYQGDFGRSSYSSTSLPNETDVCCINSIPVVSGTKVTIDIKGSNSYIVSAKFFPCQGNV